MTLFVSLDATLVNLYLSVRHVQVVWTGMTRKSPENAWVAKVPTWPLTFVFLGQVAAVAGGVYWVVQKGESVACTDWYRGVSRLNRATPSQSATGRLNACVEPFCWGCVPARLRIPILSILFFILSLLQDSCEKLYRR